VEVVGAAVRECGCTVISELIPQDQADFEAVVLANFVSEIERADVLMLKKKMRPDGLGKLSDVLAEAVRRLAADESANALIGMIRTAETQNFERDVTASIAPITGPLNDRLIGLCCGHSRFWKRC
jgi:hypothetical protein